MSYVINLRHQQREEFLGLYCLFLTCKASLGTAGLSCEHLVDAAKAAGREPLVVDLVPGGRPGEHDEVPVLSTRDAVSVILRVVGRAEVVTHLVRHGHVGHCGRHVLAIVHQGDDTCVEALIAPAVMLKSEDY